MESASPQDPNRIAPIGEMPFKQENPMGQPLGPKDERNTSANNSTDAVIVGPHNNVSEYVQSTYAAGNLSVMPPIYTYPNEQMTPNYGYGNSAGYFYHLNAADGMHVSPVIYNDNTSIMYQGYGFNPEMSDGQYSPFASPMASMMLDGSGYMLPFGSFGGGNTSARSISSPLTSPAAYPQTIGILGSYEHHFVQSPSHGYDLTSTCQHGGPYQRSTYESIPAGNDRRRLTLDKGRRREKDQDSIYSSNDSLGFDHNRGPRAFNLKGKSSSEQSFSRIGKDGSSVYNFQLSLYNRQDFVTDYKNAKLFIIKSFSEDNVHKSIKYGVWSSTPHGNKKLDAVYCEAKDVEGSCPIFLFFSVNASGQFCGVAEMAGHVDFEKDADYWQQDRWSGQFPVRWLIIKDVPNSRLRHILLENNENKPVTHSRDSQEVKLEQGIEMLKIFKDYDAQTSILDDFDFYDKREKTFVDRKTKGKHNPKTDIPDLVAIDAINQMSENFSQALRFDDGSKETALRNSNIVIPLGEDSINRGMSPAFK